MTPDREDGWKAFTFAMAGADEQRIATAPDAPTEITVRGNTVDCASGVRDNPAWTWTDWLPIPNARPDPATGMRVIIIRALIPSSQRISYAVGLFRGLTGRRDITCGFDCFVGGLKFNWDKVNVPGGGGPDASAWHHNALVNGSVIPTVQFLTRNAGIVGATTGDSHHQGTTTTDQFTNYLYRCMTSIGEERIGKSPIGIVNCAAGGKTSPEFFQRLTALLPATRPSFVVLPGWSFNDHDRNEDNDDVADQFLAQLTASAETCRSYGAVPIYLTPFPRDPGNMTTARLAAWCRIRAEIIALKEAGALVVDAAPLLSRRTTDGLDGTLIEEMGGDGIHPNDNGHAAVAKVLRSELKSLIDTNSP